VINDAYKHLYRDDKKPLLVKAKEMAQQAVSMRMSAIWLTLF